MLSMLLISSVLSGCATREEIFCAHPSYRQAITLYLREDPDMTVQEELMNNYFAYADGKQCRVAPGAYAHMGLLMYKKGEDISAMKYFDLERNTFPESKHYIDFLLNKTKQQAKVTAPTDKDGSSMSTNNNPTVTSPANTSVTTKSAGGVQ